MNRFLHFIAVLKFPTRIGDKIIKAKFIVKEMTGNTSFPSPVPPLATVNTHINTLVTKETAAKTKTTGAVAARDAALKIVVADLHALMTYVQGIADANPADAEAIIKSAGFDVKKVGEIDKQDFTADNSVSGTIKLIAKGIGTGHAAHQWGMSKNGTDWLTHAFDIAPTLAAHTEITGLTKADILYFRHRDILKDGPGEWSQTISEVVT